MMRQAAYFAEAGLLARLMNRHTLSHLHNNFADSSCSVAALAAEMGGFTFSFTIHGFREFLAHDLWWISEKIDRALFVNFISYFCRSLAMALSPSDCWEKLRIVHCGVDPTLFEVKEHRGDGHSLLYVGRLVNLKGLPILLEAIAKLQDARLIVAGEGPEGKVLQERATELGIADRVQFIGSQTQTQVRELLRQADVFVMSSFMEGIPVVLMEALAAGVPVVATRIAGIPELVEDGRSGLLVEPGNAEAIAKAVGRLLRDPDLRNQFAAEGRRKVEQEFNTQLEARWLATIFTNALSGKSVGVRP